MFDFAKTNYQYFVGVRWDRQCDPNPVWLGIDAIPPQVNRRTKTQRQRQCRNPMEQRSADALHR
ncbi:MAG: hypothetical protein ABSC42_14600 [Tepidisphaeraceae bacterium]